jgi:hypothetical protein
MQPWRFKLNFVETLQRQFELIEKARHNIAKSSTVIDPQTAIEFVAHRSLLVKSRPDRRSPTMANGELPRQSNARPTV